MRSKWVLGLWRLNLVTYLFDTREIAFKGLLSLIWEYAWSVWDPSNTALQDEVEILQNHATRFVTENLIYCSLAGILKLLKWQSLKQWRKHRGLMHTASTCKDGLLHPKGIAWNMPLVSFKTLCTRTYKFTPPPPPCLPNHHLKNCKSSIFWWGFCRLCHCIHHLDEIYGSVLCQSVKYSLYSWHIISKQFRLQTGK